MLDKFKAYWGKFRLAITAAALALAYLIGKKKGTENEKARQDKKVLENLGAADKARRSLDNNPALRRRVRDKYTRK